MAEHSLEKFEIGQETYLVRDESKAVIDHASTSSTYGMATGSNYGHTKLFDSIGDNTDGAATQRAVNAALTDESEARSSADEVIIESLEDETAARVAEDAALESMIQEVAVKSDWDESDANSLKYIDNHPVPISRSEILAIFVEQQAGA